MKKMCLFAFISIIAINAFGLDETELFFIPGEKLVFREISNISQKIDGQYLGLVSKEEKGILSSRELDGLYEGYFYISGELKRDARFVQKPLDKNIKVALNFDPNNGFCSGNMEYPGLQGFPVFPKGPVSRGDKWTAYSHRYVDPLNKGVFTKITFLCEYAYDGFVKYADKSAEHITAQYALRYKKQPGNGDPDLLEIKYAAHFVDIYLFADGSGIAIVDKIGIGKDSNEEYRYSNGCTALRSGTILTWISTAGLYRRDLLIADFKNKISEKEGPEASNQNHDREIPDNEEGGSSNIGGIEVGETEEGVKLALRDIHFMADSSAIMSSERERIDLLAELLLSVSNKTILVQGHTASIGRFEGEKKLSEERALAIINELIDRGIPASRFLYEGMGGSQPVASNENEEGRKQNRRVEIVILDD